MRGCGTHLLLQLHPPPHRQLGALRLQQRQVAPARGRHEAIQPRHVADGELRRGAPAGGRGAIAAEMHLRTIPKIYKGGVTLTSTGLRGVVCALAVTGTGGPVQTK
eukprot:867250-Pyramimonas_sp.AAC.1